METMNETRRAPAHWVDLAARPRDASRRRPRWVVAAVAMAEVIFATEGGPAPAARLAWLADELEDFLRHAGPRARLVVVTSARVIDHAAPKLLRRWGTARGLAFADRVEALERIERSPLALALFALKALLCILWYEHPESAAEIGFDGRCVGQTPNLDGEVADVG